MRARIYIFLLASFYCLSCKSTPEVVGQTIIHFDTSKGFAVSKKRTKIDTCILRFRTAFNHDTIRIISGKSQHFIIATTNRSLAYAASVSTKNDGEDIMIEIANMRFKLTLRKEYAFIDINYERKTKQLDISYSNTILVLS